MAKKRLTKSQKLKARQRRLQAKKVKVSQLTGVHQPDKSASRQPEEPTSPLIKKDLLKSLILSLIALAIIFGLKYFLN